MRGAVSGVWLVVAACAVLCAAVTARAQTAGTDTTAAKPTSPFPGPNPVVAAADSSYAPRYRFSPVFVNKISADVSKVGMSNDFHVGYTTPWGSIFDFGVSDDEKNYRLQNQLERTKVMRLSDLHTFNLFWNGSANYSDSRVFNRTVGVGGTIQDFIINDKQVNFNSTYKRKLFGMRTDLSGTGGAIESERTFKDDRGLQAGVNGGVGYNFGEHVTWQERGALRGSRDQSFTTETQFDRLGSSEDSLMTRVGVELADSLHFDVSHLDYHGDRTFADQARGSQGAQAGGAENVFQEGEHRDTRNTTLTLSSLIFTRLRMSMTGSHDEQKYAYDVQDTRFSRTVTDGVTANINYTMPWKTISLVTFETNQTLRDFNSSANVRDKRKKVGVTLSHKLSQTLSLDFQGSTQLTQSFYLDYVNNPRDRDQVDNSASLRLISSPFRKISAAVSVVYTYSDFVNIDSTQSENNRTRQQWELRPSFSYYLNPRITIIQNYGLSFDYSDYAFKNTENFLDRNLTFSNEVQYHPAKSISTHFRYEYLFHDNGSYLPDPELGQDVLQVKSKDRRDRTSIRVDYTPVKTLAFFAENLYSRSEDRLTGATVSDVNTDGQIEVGTNVNYDWGTGRYLRMTVSHVKRFSPFGAEAEKDYWNATSEFSYPF